jgi:hypothetical protein
MNNKIKFIPCDDFKQTFYFSRTNRRSMIDPSRPHKAKIKYVEQTLKNKKNEQRQTIRAIQKV